MTDDLGGPGELAAAGDEELEEMLQALMREDVLTILPGIAEDEAILHGLLAEYKAATHPEATGDNRRKVVPNVYQRHTRNKTGTKVAHPGLVGGKQKYSKSIAPAQHPHSTRTDQHTNREPSRASEQTARQPDTHTRAIDRQKKEGLHKNGKHFSTALLRRKITDSAGSLLADR